jgi:hypothetical protein
MASVVPLKSAKKKEPARPYEPTPCEAEALASYDRRKAKHKPVPSMKLTMSQEGDKRAAKIEVDHPDAKTGYKLLSESLGIYDRDFLTGALDSLAQVSQTGPSLNQDKMNSALAMVRGLQPRDHAEVALGIQMAAVHMATMRTAALLGASQKSEHIEAYEKSLNRLARTYVAQMEGLKRYRSKGEQRVYVERVTVNEGGQAIVGAVTHGGGVHAKSEH